MLFCSLQLRRSFEALDYDHDGFITSSDLLHLQQHLLGQHHMTKELADDMMSEVSSCISDAHDGKMDYQEVRGCSVKFSVSVPTNVRGGGSTYATQQWSVVWWRGDRFKEIRK